MPKLHALHSTNSHNQHSLTAIIQFLDQQLVYIVSFHLWQLKLQTLVDGNILFIDLAHQPLLAMIIVPRVVLEPERYLIHEAIANFQFMGLACLLAGVVFQLPAHLRLAGVLLYAFRRGLVL